MTLFYHKDLKMRFRVEYGPSGSQAYYNPALWIHEFD